MSVETKLQATKGQCVKLLLNRQGLLEAFGMVSGVVPSRSPKPIIQNVKLIADPDEGTVLVGTDLEVGIRHRVLGVKVDRPGSVILPTAQIGQILRTSNNEELSLDADDDKLIVRGLQSEFKFLAEDASLFPDTPDFGASSYHVVAAADLKRLIRRTIFATDAESTRYALGGCLIELEADSIAMVGTDGRRLAKMTAPAEVEGEPGVSGSPVIPAKALKLIERNLDDEDPPVHLAFTASAVLVRTAQATIWSRLVEGRYPRYLDVFPAEAAVRIPLEAGPVRSALEQALIATSQESRGVDFRFAPGTLTLSSRSADVGSARIETPIDYDGKPVDITFDPRYLLDALKTIDGASVITAELIDAKHAAVFKTEDQYAYVIMPLTRDK